jgi:DNA repair protein RadC
MTQTEFAHAPSINIQMVREKEVFYNGNKVIQADNASEAFCALLGNPDREFFVAILLDGQNRITGLHVVSQGSLNQSICHPRETFKAAILANSASIILAHNHPSGNLTPSSEDIQITRRMKEAGDLLGIRVLDHVIVNTNDGSNYSFTNMGQL